MSNVTDSRELDELVRDIMKVPYSKHQAEVVIQAYCKRQVVAALEKLKQYNGSYIGMNGKRVDHMVHYQVINEAIAALNVLSGQQDVTK